MTARVFVHPACMTGDKANTLAETLIAHGLPDALVFDHPPRAVRRNGKLVTVRLHELVHPVPALPGVFSCTDGVVFSTNRLLA